MKTVPRRWTADTTTAFALALEASGNVREACERIGRDPGTAHQRRRVDADLDARWEAALTAYQHAWQARAGAAADARADRLAMKRHDGWSPLRRRAFLRALTETADVREACQRVRISQTSAHNLRKADPEFAGAWDAAMDRAAPMLEQVAWERAVEGWEEPIVVRGEVVGSRRRYSDTLLRTLLLRERHKPVPAGAPGLAELKRRAQEAARAAGGGYFDHGSAQRTDALLRRNLDGLAKRLRAGAAANGEPSPEWLPCDQDERATRRRPQKASLTKLR
ncbi:hypothetical protein [Sphingomonas sp.]|uniref:hypothetical protein n=1 Tax=Sphingomonas sp. TaxID=28214 RepID=UPI002DD6A845|nr:hypothetical protein [Sphingomonas sp.]